MSGAIATTALIGGGLAAAGGIGGALISSNAAGQAAGDQSQAAEQAAQLQYQASQNALDFQKQQYNTSQQQAAPFIQSGQGAISNLDYLLGIGPNPGGGLGGTTGQPPGQVGSSSGAPPAVGGPMLPPGGVSQAQMGSVGTYNPTTGQGTSTPYAGAPPTQGGPMGAPRATSNAIMGGSGSYTPGEGTVSPSQGALDTSIAQPADGMGATSTLAPGMQRFGGSHAPPTNGSPISAPQAPNTSNGAYGSLMQPYQGTFQAPTGLTEQNDPGYQARLNLGQQAMDRSAAARGGVLTGGTAQAENQAAQDYASNEYGNVYNRALDNFSTNYNVYNQNQNNQFNRLAAISGMGQTSVQQLGMLGQNAANGVSSNLMGTASSMGQDYQNAAAANASGIVGGANAWSGALGGAGNNLSQLLMLQQLYGGNSGASSGGYGIGL